MWHRLIYPFFSQSLKQSCLRIILTLFCSWENNHRWLKNDLHPTTKWQGWYPGPGLLDLKVELCHTGFPPSLLDWSSYTSPNLTLSLNKCFFALVGCVLYLAVNQTLLCWYILCSFFPSKLCDDFLFILLSEVPSGFVIWLISKRFDVFAPWHFENTS